MVRPAGPANCQQAKVFQNLVASTKGNVVPKVKRNDDFKWILESTNPLQGACGSAPHETFTP